MPAVHWTGVSELHPELVLTAVLTHSDAMRRTLN